MVEKPLILDIIAQMGSAEDISDESSDRDLQYETPRIPRRLYRDTANANSEVSAPASANISTSIRSGYD